LDFVRHEYGKGNLIIIRAFAMLASAVIGSLALPLGYVARKRNSVYGAVLAVLGLMLVINPWNHEALPTLWACLPEYSTYILSCWGFWKLGVTLGNRKRSPNHTSDGSMVMKTTGTIPCLFVVVVTNVLAGNEFMALNTNAFQNPLAVANPFSNLTASAIRSVEVENGTTTAVVTDPVRVARFVARAADLKVVDGWITLNGPGYFSLQHFRDMQTNTVLTTGINTTDGEVVVVAPTGMVGVAYEAQEYMRHVQAVQPFTEISGQIEMRERTPKASQDTSVLADPER
jgi:hypothetical protein